MKKWADKAFQEWQRDPSRKIVFLLPTDRLNRKYLEQWLPNCKLTLVRGNVFFKPLVNQKVHDNGFHLPVCLLTLGEAGFTLL